MKLNKPTLLGIPAYEADDNIPIPLEVDPYGELPTNPIPDPEFRIPTERPSLSELATLLSASSGNPKFEYDHDVRSWILAESFTATQVDSWGNTYIIPCRRGCKVNISLIIEPRAIRSECVRMALEDDCSVASVLMNSSRFPTPLGLLGKEAVLEIAFLFYRADMS